jgi:6-pyruvoyltetrahydropterin/6-carboxytetrahydropterin synthase
MEGESSSIVIYVTRKVHFNAAHKLYNPKWSKEKNQEVFGGCANENWHGHNYVLEVTISVTPDPETGYVVDLKILKEILEEARFE